MFGCLLCTELHGICGFHAHSAIILVEQRKRERILMDTVENAENQVNEETDIEIFDITLLDFLDDLI